VDKSNGADFNNARNTSVTMDAGLAALSALKKSRHRFFLFWFAFRCLFSRRPKSAFVILVSIFSMGSVFIGVAALIVSLSLVNGFEDEVRSRMIGTTAHISVFSFEKSGLINWKKELVRIKDMSPEITAVSPFIYSKVAISSKKGKHGIMERGVPSFL
jgi:lipoprotein-releasing system permease protein